MSLRLRLLLAVGAIAIVALVVADIATYSALRSSLYNQVDQELSAHQYRFLENQTTGRSSAHRRRATSEELRSRPARVPILVRAPETTEAEEEAEAALPTSSASASPR